MKNMPINGHRAGTPRVVRFLLSGALACMMGLATAPLAAATLSAESQACQKCHDKPDLTMKTQDGKTWSMHVSTEAYLKSRHDTTDCADCHDDIDGDKHAKDKPAVKSRRDYAKTLDEGCKTCHKKHVAQFKDSVHAAMLRDGSEKAPLCSDCHDVHTQPNVKIVAPIEQTPCLKCHEEIGKAYAADVHGLERVAKGKAAPICADCHKAHAIQAASAGEGIKDACLACHKDATAQHKDWLPNAGRHFEAISCPVCHAPTAQRRVNLRMYSTDGKHQLAEKAGVPRFERMVKAVDERNLGLDERALWSLLQEFNREGGGGDVVLRGRLEVRQGVQAHQIAEKEKAIQDCDTCHRADAQAFDSVVLTIAGADGRPLRHAVDNKVLTSLMATESVRGFYAIGANRIKLLDWLLVLVVLGSVGGVAAHMTAKWATRRIRARLAAEQHAAPK